MLGSKSFPPSWTVGELSDATGLSVRVLRHRERLGLVAPARNAGGHRRYGPEEITRLYRAMALRRTGLRPRQIGALLGQDDPNPAATLSAHLADIEADLRRRIELRDGLDAALADVAPDGSGSFPQADP